MGRTFSLRGTVTQDDNTFGQHHQILEYESPDRTKGWKIREAYVWPAGWQESVGSSDGQYGLAAHLSTDSWTIVGAEEYLDTSDNRQCAWIWDQLIMRHDTSGDMLLPAGGNNYTKRMLIDPDTTVSTALYIAIAGRTEFALVSNSRQWSYMVVLEEVTLAPQESVFLQIKGMGQDITA